MQFLFNGTNHEDLQKRHIVQIKDFSGGISLAVQEKVDELSKATIGCHNM